MLSKLLVLFLLFPFSQIIPLATYNQPYALIMAFFVHLSSLSILWRIPQIDRIFLIYSASVGTIFYLFALVDIPEFRSILYWLSYVSPIIIVPAVFHVLQTKKDKLVGYLEIGILVWVAVALVQIFIYPSFLVFLVTSSQDLALDILRSGRGVLGLAPEPTHHGFHVLILSISLFLLGGKRWIVILGVFDALLIAQSSSAMLAIALGGLIWAALRPWRWVYLFAFIASINIIPRLVLLVVNENGRMGRLLRLFEEQGFGVLLVDASANSRFYGMYAPIMSSFESFFVPLGLTNAAWRELRIDILNANHSILQLSEIAPQSGFGILIVQGGFFMLPFILYCFIRMCWDLSKTWHGILACTVFIIFLSQLTLSTPSFSLIFAILIFTRTNPLYKN